MAQQEAMQQTAGRANERQLRGKQDAGALADKRQWRDKRASMDEARLPVADNNDKSRQVLYPW